MHLLKRRAHWYTRRVARLFDLTLQKWTDTTVAGFRYRTIQTGATYSPWLTDRAFAAVHALIKDHTLVDELRCYELWDVAGQALGRSGDILEVGVWRGGTGALLAKRAAASGKTIFLCDTFTGVVKAGEQDASYSGGEHADTSEDIVRELLRRLGAEATILKGIFPDQTGNFVSGPLCLVHIDVDVYQSAKDVLAFAWPKLVIGGVVVFDDFGFITCDGVARLVEETKGEPDRVIFYNVNGHAVVVKTA